MDKYTVLREDIEAMTEAGLTDAEIGETLLAMVRYGMDGTEPDFNAPGPRIAFAMLKSGWTNISANAKPTPPTGKAAAGQRKPKKTQPKPNRNPTKPNTTHPKPMIMIMNRTTNRVKITPSLPVKTHTQKIRRLSPRPRA